ncbi:MAG: AAA family ATPase, partial [Geminicoccaceae bacterium]
MIIRSIQLEQFRKFDQPVIVEGFSSGLNLIAGPNEMGKSTLLLALRAALFERHSSKSQAIKSLQPNYIQGAAPSVTVELELDDGLYRVEKRFLRRPLARLTRPNEEIAEGNEAEIEIRKILGLEQDDVLSLDKGSPGHFGVMFTPQSQSFYQPSFTQNTRHTLEEAITAEIEQLGNQSEVDAVLANVEEARLEIVHKNNKPKGRFKDVEARISNLQNEIAVLRDDQDELASDIDALNEAERTLRSLEDSEAEEDLKARLDDLEHKRAGLVRRKEIEAKIAAARLRVERLLMTRDQRQKRSAERVELTAELDQRKQEESELRAQLTEREA